MKAVVAAFKKAVVAASRGLLRDYKPSDLLRMELFEALVAECGAKLPGSGWVEGGYRKPLPSWSRSHLSHRYGQDEQLNNSYFATTM